MPTTPTAAFWEQLFPGDPTRILKALYGSFLVRDWRGPATSLAAFSPFDSTTGNLRSDLLVPFADGGQGFIDPGYCDENGVQFTPKYTTVDTMAWQSRQAMRTDVTLDQEEAQAVFIESTPTVDYLNYNKPLQDASGANIVPALGTPGYKNTKPPVPLMTYRQVLAIGVDGSSGNNEYFATAYSRALMVKPEKYAYQAKTEVQTSMTFDSYPDPSSGFSVIRFREGPAWRASGGTTGAPGTPVATAVSGGKATLEFTPPTVGAGPFTWNVIEITGGVSTPVPGASVTITSSTSSDVVLTVSGLTTGNAYTFTVQATSTVNGSQSVPSGASNSITALS